MDTPETRYAVTTDGVHVAYQVIGEGVPDRWRLYRVAD
jgi:hypothetical protein